MDESQKKKVKNLTIEHVRRMSLLIQSFKKGKN